MQNLLLVFAGGGIGAVCRYLVTTHVGERFGVLFPWGTLTVNTLGSFLMGLILGVLFYLAEHFQLATDSLRLLLTVGFLGGFTTFSSFSMETMTLLRGGSYLYAVANILLNVILGLLFVWLGLTLAKFVMR